MNTNDNNGLRPHEEYLQEATGGEGMYNGHGMVRESDALKALDLLREDMRKELERRDYGSKPNTDLEVSLGGYWNANSSKKRAEIIRRAFDWIDALIEYNQLLSDECSELVGMAAIHGWKSNRVEQGKKLRLQIANITGEPPSTKQEGEEK